MTPVVDAAPANCKIFIFANRTAFDEALREREVRY
jgi:hypothetical protein